MTSEDDRLAPALGGNDESGDAPTIGHRARAVYPVHSVMGSCACSQPQVVTADEMVEMSNDAIIATLDAITTYEKRHPCPRCAVNHGGARCPREDLPFRADFEAVRAVFPEAVDRPILDGGTWQILTYQSLHTGEPLTSAPSRAEAWARAAQIARASERDAHA